jgi:hypothetical protein
VSLQHSGDLGQTHIAAAAQSQQCIGLASSRLLRGQLGHGQRRFRLSDVLAFLEMQQAETIETVTKSARRIKRDSGEELPAVEKRL